MPIFLGACAILTFSLNGLEATLNISFFNGFRQIFIFCVFLLIWIFRSGAATVPKKYLSTVTGLVSILIIGGIINSVPPLNVITGAFMTVEFALIFYLASSTRVSIIDLERFASLFLGFLAINASVAVISHIDEFPNAMRSAAGVQGNAGFFASALNIGVTLLLGRHLLRRKRAYTILAGLFSIVVFLTVIKKALVINLLIWLFWASILGQKKFIQRILPAVGIIAAGFIFSTGALRTNITENIQYLDSVGFEEHVRLIMYYAGFQIALDHFPLGSGAGSFGSLASISGYYSPLYDLYGVSMVPTNSLAAVQGGYHTLLDTYWPHVIAESGFIGTTFLIYLFLVPIHQSITALRKYINSPEILFCAFIAMCIPMSLLLEGFALYTTEAPSFVMFLGGISGYSYRILRKKFNN